MYTAGRSDVLREYTNSTEFHQTFAFDLLLSPWHGPSIRRAIEQPIAALAADGLLPAWALNNHDAHRAVTRYGRADATDPDSWSGDNLVNSVAPVDIAVGTRRAAAMAVTMLALPGSSYLYQGEELGLPEVLDLPAAARQDPVFRRTAGRELGRDGCRVPLPWTDSGQANHGFSAGLGEAVAAPAWLPQPTGWGAYAAASQDADPSSMLTLYRSALRARRECLLGMGDRIEWIDDLGDDAVAFDRGTVHVVLNLSGDRLALPERIVAQPPDRALVGAGSRRSASDPRRRRRLARVNRYASRREPPAVGRRERTAQNATVRFLTTVHMTPHRARAESRSVENQTDGVGSAQTATTDLPDPGVVAATCTPIQRARRDRGATGRTPDTCATPRLPRATERADGELHPTRLLAHPVETGAFPDALTALDSVLVRCR